MSKFLNFTTTLILLSSICLPTFLSANPVGRAVDVIQNATIEQAGRKNSLQQGQTVALGDVITTGGTGQVHLLFQDETRIAISANSRLVIENILFDSSNMANTFAVNAVGGAFRFLSGGSEKSAYSVSTPNGTMGIRGTTFDFNVFPEGDLSLVTFRGEVELCNRSNRCARVRGGCAAVRLDSSGEFVVPETRDQKAALLSRGFPYIRQQNSLLRDYRAPVWACGSQTTQNPGPGSGSVAPEQPSPQSPGVGGAHAGNNTSSGSGGASADGVDAGAGGPSAPGDANAGPGGASAGGASAGGGGASAGSH